MALLDPITTKTIDVGEGQRVIVEELPLELQNLVALYDAWQNEERDLRLTLHQKTYAIKMLNAEIGKKLGEHINPEEQETAEGEGQAEENASTEEAPQESAAE